MTPLTTFCIQTHCGDLWCGEVYEEMEGMGP
jgi:hypothetical protein